ncbi:helix-turn-helix domain-containing protein [Hymenobacter glacieicola]|uniref:helix-turn-helix domain-containing protein n=1 Tax=Hymenobacter glacieicola TaxID=1562124 RepID=UPI001662E178
MIEQRIRELLSARQLTPTQLADTIGVSRPIVSHILSGRNKPSLEVVQKIIVAFPDLSLPWLLSGAGPMTALAPTPAPEAPRIKAIRPQPEVVAVQHPEEATVAINLAASAPVASTPIADNPEPATPLPPTQPLKVLTTPSVQSKPSAAALNIPPTSEVTPSPAGTGKSIRRIVIFYHDGTFADFQPESPTQ